MITRAAMLLEVPAYCRGTTRSQPAMREVIVTIDPRLVATLGVEDADIEHAILQELLLELFRRGEISRGRASELLGIPLAEFLAIASSRKIGVVSL